jgi:photosystem II stability/assembly factor-like uncharacterized protein
MLRSQMADRSPPPIAALAVRHSRAAILRECADGKHPIARASGTSADLQPIVSTADGTHLWVVGDDGTILESLSAEL